MGDCGLSPGFSRSRSFSFSRSLSKSPPIGKTGLVRTEFEERPYGLDILWRIGLGRELGSGWERDALKLEEGRGSWAGIFLLDWIEDKECVVVLWFMSVFEAILANEIYTKMKMGTVNVVLIETRGLAKGDKNKCPQRPVGQGRHSCASR